MKQFPAQPVVGVGAVIVDDGRVLLIKRGHAPLKGEWSLPGGAVELGESLEQALVREVREETGLEVVVGPVVEIFERIQRNAGNRVEYHFVVVDYVCRPCGGHLAHASDADDACWVTIDELPTFKVTAKATSVIHKALALSRHTFSSEP